MFLVLIDYIQLTGILLFTIVAWGTKSTQNVTN